MMRNTTSLSTRRSGIGRLQQAVMSSLESRNLFAASPATAGLMLWLDSRNAASIVTNASGGVTKWKNIAPGATNSVNYTGLNDNSTNANFNTSAPTVVTGPGNTKVIQFNGKGYFSNLNFSSQTPNALTVFILTAPDSNAGAYRAFMAFRQNSTTNDYNNGLNIDQGAIASTQFSRLNIEGAKSGGFGGKQYLSAPLPFKTFHTIQVNYGINNVSVNAIVNGQQSGTVNGFGNPINIKQLFIGTRAYTSGGSPGSNHDLVGRIATVLVYNGILTGAALTQTKTYLSQFFVPPVTPPKIGSFVVTPNPALTGSNLTLKASSIAANGGTVNQVKFYRETNGTPGLQTGSGSDTIVGTASGQVSGSWNVTIATTGLAAKTYTYYAVAHTVGGLNSPTVTATHMLAAPAKISGRVFNDKNHNGSLDTGENGLSPWIVYLDLNNSGGLDSSDRKVTTDASGNWSFGNLLPGTYFVRLVLQAGKSITTPVGGKFSSTLISGQNLTSLRFGIR